MGPALTLLKKCTSICEDLHVCLEEETHALVHFEIEKVLENNLKKENLVKALVDRRKELKQAIKMQFDEVRLDAIFSKLDKKGQSEWKKALELWNDAWKKTQVRCKQNQKFIEHSLKNLSMFTDHLKELFGANTIYSQQGVSVDPNTSGSVVEGKY